MTRLQQEKLYNQTHEILDDHGIITIKAIFPAYNLADGFEEDLKDVGISRQYITRRNRIFVITISNSWDFIGDPHEQLGYILATAIQYAAESVKYI